MAAELLVNIDVDDLDRAERFYTSAFGLIAGRRFGDGMLELTGGTSRIYLLLKASSTRATGSTGAVRVYERHWTPVHIDIVVDDIESAVKRAVDAGAVLERPVKSDKWGKLAVLADPFGHGFCLVQFLGKGYDEIATDG